MTWAGAIPAAIALAALLLATSVAQAQARAPETSPRPSPRPGGDFARIAPAAPAFTVRVGFRPTVRPKPRPVRVVQVASAASVPAALDRSLRPAPRPDNLRRRNNVAASGLLQALAPARRVTRRGSVCGVNEIKGQRLAAIPAKLPGCGVAEPVRVASVAGVTLSHPAVMDCTTAKALNEWVKTGVIPAVGRRGGGAAELKVIADYSCRTRNNRAGARISEHGKGRALDVAGVTLKNGVTLSVADGWRDPSQARIFRAMHRSACGPFGTVLGPNADRYHQDHLHVDTARYRGGPYCK